MAVRADDYGVAPPRFDDFAIDDLCARVIVGCRRLPSARV